MEWVLDRKDFFVAMLSCFFIAWYARNNDNAAWGSIFRTPEEFADLNRDRGGKAASERMAPMRPRSTPLSDALTVGDLFGFA